jgi:hypothetical protein
MEQKKTSMSLRTGAKAGGIHHNQGLAVETRIRSGAIASNHNQSRAAKK